MTTYFVEYDIATTYRCRVTAPGPQEAVEQFWLDYHDGHTNPAWLGDSGPQGIRMTLEDGTPLVVGTRTDLS